MSKHSARDAKSEVAHEFILSDGQEAEDADRDANTRVLDRVRESNLAKLERLAKIAASIAVGASAIVAVQQYVESGDVQRRGQSIAIINSWQTGKNQEAYARLAAAVEAVVKTKGALPVDLKGDELRLATAGLGRNVMKKLASEKIQYKGNWKQDVDKLVRFYSEIQFCIKAQLCEIELLKDYFEPSARSFWVYFCPYADQRRAEYYPQYGRDVDALLTSFRNLK